MDNPEDLLSFLDLLDLDEEVVDRPLKQLMYKSKLFIKHMKSALQLLQYKILINVQEGTDCENDEEFIFVVRLLKDMSMENVDYVCKIINIVLCLNPSKIVSKAEHLLQQILSGIVFHSETQTSPSLDYDTCIQTLLSLKATASILDATLKKGFQVSLLILETPLEKILDCTDETLKIYFLTKTVPRFVDGVIGYNILDRIWAHIQNFKGDRIDDALKVLSCLSDYYLPTPNAEGDARFVSNIIFQYNFWDIVLHGITSNDGSVRKLSVYLSKKAIDCVVCTKKDVCVKSINHTILQWRSNYSHDLKNMWDNFFVLIDSLEEKQPNIVLPSLKLFEGIDIGYSWINAAFKIGLQHDNTQVRLKCIEYRLKTKIRNKLEAQVLLEALNDINIYDQSLYYEDLKTNFADLLKDPISFREIFETISHIKWSPIPLYHLTDTLANLKINGLTVHNNNITNIIIDILKIPCNNVVLRKTVQVNIIYFIKNCCNHLSWNDIASVYSIIQSDISSTENPFISIVEQLSLTSEDKKNNLKTMSERYHNIDFIIMYLSNHQEDTGIFIDIINKKLKQIHESLNRQYSDKKEYINEAIFLVHLLSKTRYKDSLLHNVNEVIARQNKIILQYILSLFSSEVKLSIEDVTELFEKHEYEFVGEDLGVILLQLYKTATLFLKDNPELDKAVLSIFVLKMLLKNSVMVKSYGHEMLNLQRFIHLMSNLEFQDSPHESVGRLKNVFYEKSCAIIYIMINRDEKLDICLTQVTSYIENVLECGGYGCLKWILKIVNKIIVPLTNEETNFNMIQFINRTWNEIEELKSNNQYSSCIEEFVELITQDALLKKAMYNNIVISYCNKIIEYGPVKTNPLYYLIKKLNNKDVKDYGHLIYVLCEILLYCPVPRKDQRISDNVTLEVLQNPKYGINKEGIDIHFNYEIQYLSVATLCNIHDTETLRMITNFITIRIDNTFKNKQRYHGNSYLHRILQTALQHVLILVLKSSNIENMLNWCLDLLMKLPHQPSVRISIEWIISLYFYIQKINLSEPMLQIFKSKNVPLTSQFFIMYWLLKHKISHNTYTEDEYYFVLDFLLFHTMGQLFNVRLNAQYLATTLYKLANKPTKYQYTIDIIEKTFAGSNGDKNFLKLKNDYFSNDFDIIDNLNPYFVYYLLPRLCDIDNNEKSDTVFIKIIMKDICESISRSCVHNDFISEWKNTCSRRADDQLIELGINKCVDSKVIEDSESLGTIQKKYIPWRNMSDVNVYDVEKRECPSQLIVVASLIDKLPNLGGMARTSEVFGVQTYVVDSLRHLQDMQFQGLSVSAERWINIEEVRPGRPLKEYLMRKKEEGYAVVAAEQTSTSSKLQAFKFPKKTLLLLGHEKEGVPSDLLPLMDYCVEIPQQGFVRSLNVHVTAAIFAWEYARQNVL